MSSLARAHFYVVVVVVVVVVFAGSVCSQCAWSHEILWRWWHALLHTGNKRGAHQCDGVMKGRVRQKMKEQKRENGESASQEREREGLKISLTIDFQSRTPTVTQTFFGAELKEKKRRRGEEEASRAVPCRAVPCRAVPSRLRTRKTKDMAGCLRKVSVTFYKDVSFGS